MEVQNTSERAIAEYVLQMRFVDRTGGLIEPRLTGPFRGRSSDTVKAGAKDRGAWSVNQFSWPVDRISTVEAQAIQVTYLDGEQWVHPAVEAGLFGE